MDPARLTCYLCAKVIADAYFRYGGIVVCVACREHHGLPFETGE